MRQRVPVLSSTLLVSVYCLTVACAPAAPPANPSSSRADTAAPPAATTPPPATTAPSAPAAAAELPTAPPVDGVACAGKVDPPPEGTREVTDEALLTLALDATGKGKLCTGRVFEVVRAVKIYRVWNSAKTYTELGKWWSLSAPSGPVEKYREQNAICPEWSELNMASVCEIKIGARFVLGPGQSARCDGGKEYPKSAVNQVFVANDTREQLVFVEHCEKLGPWP